MNNVNQPDSGQSSTSVTNDGIGGLIDVGALIKVIFDNIRILIAFMTLSIVAACIYALILTPVYRSEALLVAAENNDEALGSLMGGFSQIGSLFGSSGVAGGSIDNSIVGQEVIRSRDFLYSYIQKRDLLVPLLAAKEWNIGDATYEINEEIYDLKNKQWLAYQNPSSLKSPIYYEAFIILEPLISVAQDRKTGLIKVNFDHPTPQLASQWLKWLIDDLNDYFRKDDSQEAEASVKYLTQAIQDNPVKQVDLVLTSLIEKQLNTLMLTNSKSGYVYKILDTPYEPIQRISPRRTLIVIVLTAFSSIFFTFLILGLHWSGKKLTFTGIKNTN